MSNASWYARKLAEQRPAPAPRPAPVQNVILPSERPMTQAPAPAPTHEGRCPDCGSGNYFMKGTPRCFDCGYIQGRDFKSEAAGMVADGPVRKAFQVESAGYQPGTIIGHVS